MLPALLVEVDPEAAPLREQRRRAARREVKADELQLRLPAVLELPDERAVGHPRDAREVLGAAEVHPRGRAALARHDAEPHLRVRGAREG